MLDRAYPFIFSTASSSSSANIQRRCQACRTSASPDTTSLPVGDTSLIAQELTQKMASPNRRSSRFVQSRKQQLMGQKRLSNFLAGRYSSYNLASLLYYGRSDAVTALRMTVWAAPKLDKPSFGHVVANGHFSASLSAEVGLCTRGHSFGPSCECLSSCLTDDARGMWEEV